MAEAATSAHEAKRLHCTRTQAGFQEARRGERVTFEASAHVIQAYKSSYNSSPQGFPPALGMLWQWRKPRRARTKQDDCTAHARRLASRPTPPHTRRVMA
eukprot:7923444-Pyramimonas_sp.AAC.1